MDTALAQVIFCGENPEIRLVKPNTEDEIAFLSYWHCTYSPHGVGNVLVVHIEANVLEPNADAMTLIHADNAELGRYIADTFVQHFPDIDRLNLPAVSVDVAQLSQTGDPRRESLVVSRAENATIEAVWKDLLQVRALRTYPDIITESETDTMLDVSTIICPVAQASITINGVPVSGSVHTYLDGDIHRSTAFLAFSETWLRRSATSETK